MSDHDGQAGALHGPVNYVAIYAALLVLLLVSIGLGYISNPYAMNALVFGVATVKAVLVLRYFMHVKFEPWLVVALVVAGVACLAVLFAGVMPDVVLKEAVPEHRL